MRTAIGFFVSFILVLVAPVATGTGADALALQERVRSVFEGNRKAVVRVKAAYRKPDDADGTPQVTLRVGTGFFVSKEGHVLVSASRAAGADRVWIEYRGEAYATETIGHDRLTNVSVLKLLDPPTQFSIIPIDSAQEKPALGAIAIAIACPLDFGPSPSLGLVAGIDKKLGGKIFPTEYIRTSLSVEAGKGGCPIFDINGRLLGMSVASIPELGGSFILPPAALARVRDDLMFSGHVIHSWMGFQVGERLNIDDTHAVYLSKIIDDAPAAEAGLKEDDLLVSIGGRPIETISDVPGAMFFTRVDQYTPVRVVRDGESLEISVKAVPRPEEASLLGDSDGLEEKAAPPKPSQKSTEARGE